MPDDITIDPKTALAADLRARFLECLGPDPDPKAVRNLCGVVRTGYPIAVYPGWRLIGKRRVRGMVAKILTKDFAVARFEQVKAVATPAP